MTSAHSSFAVPERRGMAAKPFALAAVVTREGRVRNLELLRPDVVEAAIERIAAELRAGAKSLSRTGQQDSAHRAIRQRGIQRDVQFREQSAAESIVLLRIVEGENGDPTATLDGGSPTRLRSASIGPIRRSTTTSRCWRMRAAPTSNVTV